MFSCFYRITCMVSGIFGGCYTSGNFTIETWQSKCTLLTILIVALTLITSEHTVVGADAFLKPVKKIYLFAPLWGNIFEQDFIASSERVSMSRDGCRDHLFLLRKELKRKGILLLQITAQQLREITHLKPHERLIFFDIACDTRTLRTILKRFKPKQCMLIIWEPPTTNPLSYDFSFHGYFSTIFTFWDKLIDNKKYYKLYYPHALGLPESTVQFFEKKLCAMIFGKKQWISEQPFLNLYKKREELVDFFENNASDSFDLYGAGWDAQLTVYKGLVPNKAACLNNYKFTITYENTGCMSGYITEKIFDAMIAGSVPIYWGADTITDYIPESCFIDARDFQTPKDLYGHIKNINELEYTCYRASIDAFLSSPEAYVFSYNYFVDTLLNALVQQKV